MFKLVRPGGVTVDNIAPNDFTGCKGWVQFQLTGPGVSLFTTLDTGCDAFLILPQQTFKPNSTYTATDLNQPSVARASFTTLASGSPVSPKSPYGTTSGKGTAQQDIVGSAAVKATLSGSVAPTGLPALKNGRKLVPLILPPCASPGVRETFAQAIDAYFSRYDQPPRRFVPPLDQIAEFVHQAEEMPPARPDARDLLVLIGREWTSNTKIQKLGVSDDGIEGRSQLVRHHGDEL